MHGTHVAECQTSRTDLAVHETPRRMLYPINEVAEQLGGIEVRTVYRKLASGEIPSIKLGGRRMVEHGDLVAYIKRCRATTTGGGQ